MHVHARHQSKNMLSKKKKRTSGVGHQTFSVNLELRDPSAEARLLPRVPRRISGFGDCGGLRCDVDPGKGVGSANGLTSSGCRMIGVLAGPGRNVIALAPVAVGDTSISFSISFESP
jgi:hypothetical protein